MEPRGYNPGNMFTPDAQTWITQFYLQITPWVIHCCAPEVGEQSLTLLPYSDTRITIVDIAFILWFVSCLVSSCFAKPILHLQPYEESMLANFRNRSGLPARTAGMRRGGSEAFRTAILVAQIVGLVLGIIGTAANAVVLALLVRVRRMFGNNVSALIANQSAMDLCSCFFIVLVILLKMTKAYTMHLCKLMHIIHLYNLHNINYLCTV